MAMGPLFAWLFYLKLESSEVRNQSGAGIAKSAAFLVQTELLISNQRQFVLTIGNRGTDLIRVTACETGCECTRATNLPVEVYGMGEERIQFSYNPLNASENTLRIPLKVYTDPPANEPLLAWLTIPGSPSEVTVP